MIRKSTRPKWVYEPISGMQPNAGKIGKGKPNEKGKGNAKTDANNDKTEDAAKEGAAGDETTFTEEQDKKLREMKTGGKTWKEIIEAVGRSKSDCTKRWKELQAQDADKDKTGGDNQGEKGNDAKKQDGKDTKQDGNEQNKGKGKGKGKAQQQDATNGDAPEYVQLDEDDEFSTEMVIPDTQCHGPDC